MIPHARSRAFAGVFAAGLCFHCGGSDRALTRGSTVVIAHQGYDGRGFNPALAGNEKDLLFLPLMRISASGELEGALAERWETFPETSDVIYHLRNGVRWHDGVPVTAHDVKFSMELMTHPDVLHEGPGLFEEIEVIDDLTLRVRDHSGGTDEVSWPKHLLEYLEAAEFYNWDFWRRPVGNGPYRFVRYQPNTFLELEANPDYVGGQPRIERLILKFTGDAGVRELVAGEVNLDRTRRMTGYEDTELIRLQKANHGGLHQDPEEKAEAYRRAHGIFVRDAPVTFLGPRVKGNVVHKRIRGLSSPWQADPIQHLEFLWIGEEPGS